MHPTVSVVRATYHRPVVLGCAIRSLRASTFEDWELIVVGDHRTDETEEVVRSFGDPRIQFESLPKNFYEHSRPNRCRMASSITAAK